MICDKLYLKDILKGINISSCPYHLNFHCHTLCSDGSLEPLELIKQACDIGIKHIAVTDHHSTEAYIKIQNWIVNNKHITTLPYLWSGVEISSILCGCLVHILGIGFDHNSPYLKPYLFGDAAKGVDLEARSVIKAISKSGGLSILAHPARYRVHYKDLILESKRLGMDGIEVWYDYDMSSQWQPTPYLCNSISEIVISNGLVPTCGTDTHGLSLLSR